jgi:hypothetical protein
MKGLELLSRRLSDQGIDRPKKIAGARSFDLFQ